MKNTTVARASYLQHEDLWRILVENKNVLKLLGTEVSGSDHLICSYKKMTNEH